MELNIDDYEIKLLIISGDIYLNGCHIIKKVSSFSHRVLFDFSVDRFVRLKREVEIEKIIKN